MSDVRVYKMEVMVIDHDKLGADRARSALENARFPNRCMAPKVVALEERTVPWSDDHALNQRDSWRPAYEVLFKPPGRCLHHTDSSGPAEYFISPFDPAQPVRCPCPGGCPGSLRVDGANFDGSLLFLCCDACSCAHVAKDGRDPVEPSPGETKLAQALVQIMDQCMRGSHGPTLMQLLQATSALREAAPRLAEELRVHIKQVDEVVSSVAKP